MPDRSCSPATSLALLSTLLSCRTYSDIQARLLGPVADHLGAPSSVFLQFLKLGDGDSRIGRHGHYGATPESLETYVGDGFFATDPCVTAPLGLLRESFDGRGARTVHLSRIPGWRNGAFDSDFLTPFDIGDVLGVTIPVRSTFENSLMCVGFHRVQDQPAFRAEDRARLEALLPAIETVLTNIAYAESLTLSGTVVDAITSASETNGIVVLDDDLAVRHANRLGLLHLNLLASADQDRVVVRSEAFGALRERLLFAAARGVPPGCFTLSPDGVDVEATEFAGPDGEPCYLLVTNASGGIPRMVQACSDHSLSLREAQVVKLVCGGNSNATIAGQLGISVRTVENHLRSIYAKVGVASRTQLISRLAFN